MLWQRHDVRTRLRVEEDAHDPERLVQRFDLAASVSSMASTSTRLSCLLLC